MTAPSSLCHVNDHLIRSEADLERRHWEHRWWVEDIAGADVETGPMAGTLDRVPVELALAEGVVLVRAYPRWRSSVRPPHARGKSGDHRKESGPWWTLRVHRRAVRRISATRASQTYAAAVSPLFSSARPATPAMRAEPFSGTLLLAIQFHRSSSGAFPRNWLRHFGTPSTHPPEAPHTPILEGENRYRQAPVLAQPCGEVRELGERSFERVPSGTRDGWIAPLLCPQASAVEVGPMAALDVNDETRDVRIAYPVATRGIRHFILDASQYRPTDGLFGHE